ncbi:MAG: DUF2764 domain-containing protein [Tannerella sp.]|jgi:hypothetical protein|nr:DUF2764 domain-containing protein [Tannerella sp.]
MSYYYCLISGLPSITLDDHKQIYSVAGFKAELDLMLSGHDRRIINRFFLKYDNRNLLSYLWKNSACTFDGRGVYTEEEIREICDLLKSEDRIPAGISVPAYFADFIRDSYERLESNGDAEMHQLREDRLSSLYYHEAMQCENKFMALWFELNLNIGNVMTAYNCRKYGLDGDDYIIGDTETAKILRRSGVRDFNTGNAPDYMSELIRIIEEDDFMMREKRLDVLRWNWLEEETFFKPFGIESVIAYLLQLEMIERWLVLDKAYGEKTFRRLVAEMKRGSSETLEKFKENNK